MKRYLITLIFLSSVFSSYALTDTVKNTFGLSDLTLNSTLLKSGKSTTVTGSRFENFPIVTSTPNFTLENSLGIIELSILKGFKAGTITVATPTVVLTVTSWTLNSSGKSLNQTTEDVTLSLDVNASKPVLRTYWSKKNAHQLNVVVKSVTGFPTSGWQLLELNTSILTSSYTELPTTTVPNFNLTHSSTLTDGNLMISWDALAGTERYELEWTYVSGRDIDPTVTATPDDDTTILAPTKLVIEGNTFLTNSSRVVITGNSFNIPLVYEKGYILYRLRAVSKKMFGTQLSEYHSMWSNGETNSNQYLSEWVSGTNPNYYLYNGLENLKNWQSSISFAEEGKTKTVVSYHDGSMRNRQAVTRINSDNRTIVGETLYDYAGRPVIQLLPVPTTKGSLSYFPNFNIINTTNRYVLKDDYIKTYTSGSCVPLAPEFDPDSGASSYYSSKNKFDNLELGDAPSRNKIINRDLIPNANKYPYTQTEYVLDNTGRINAQSGVGQNHILGSDHETKYLYSTPTQDELTRLFGTQVGNAAHYKKNIVIDANGQVSTSYLDLDGKVIATFLSGTPPKNVEDLDGASKVTPYDSEILKNNPANTINPEGTQKVLTYTVAVTSNNTPYEFKYKADAQSLDVNCDKNKDNSKRTFDGALKVDLSLTDKCQTPLITTNDTTSAGQTGTDKNLNLNPKITLNKGSYQLTKTLSVNEKVLDNYWEIYKNDSISNCLKTAKQFEEEEAAKVNVKANCNFNCDSCNALLDKLSPTNKEYQVMKKICKSICEPINPCNISLDGLKADMSPSGQYGQIRDEQVSMPDNPEPKLDANNKLIRPQTSVTINKQGGALPITPEKFALSIYNSDNLLPAQIQVLNILGFPKVVRPSWKTPIKVTFHNATSSLNDTLNSVLWENTLTNLTSFTYKETNYYNNNKTLATGFIFLLIPTMLVIKQPDLGTGIIIFLSYINIFKII